MARLGLVAAILATLMILAPVAAAATTVSYPENGTDPVDTFSATDEDGDPITWSLDGDDKGDFKISDDGVLEFKSSPNFESPADKNQNNVYLVTVQATSDGQTATEAVEVTVTDVDEAGKVTLTQPQPQVGRNLTASLSDVDAPVQDERWQWARGATADGPFTDIDKATTASRDPVAADDGMYLQATVTYEDKFGTGKTASAVTENSVEPRTRANAAPSFSQHTDTDTAAAGIQVARAVDEGKKNVNVGKPVAARDGDNDVLLYKLGEDDVTRDTVAADGTVTVGTVEIDPATLFSINPRSGQLTTKTDGLNSDDDGVPGTHVRYTIKVIATDPSGAPGEADVYVTINDINDAPKIAEGTAAQNRKALTVVENADTSDQATTPVIDAVPGTALIDAPTFLATDDDTGDINATAGDSGATPPTVPLQYSIEGADKGVFELSSTTSDGTVGVTLRFKSTHTPNYEKQKEYSISIVAKDDSAPEGVATFAVKVTVTNAEDDGEVELSQLEPQVGTPVIARLTDEDGNIRNPSWQWQRATATLTAECSTLATTDPTDDTGWTDIPGENSPSYTPKAADIPVEAGADAPRCLRAQVTYTDGYATTGDAAAEVTKRDVQKENPANSAPKFADDQDVNTPGDQADAERSVEENESGANVGDPVTALPVDGDLLMYTISGDSESFKINRESGQITTAVKLDYETKDSYMVVVTATDPSGATDTINVNISVIDVNDKPVISRGPAVNTPPAFDEGDTAERAVDENMPAGTNVGDPVTATEEDPGQSLTYTLNGGGGNFEIDPATGQITTTGSLDYEVEDSYSVTVTASDGQDENSTDTIDVTITVGDMSPGCMVGGEHALTNDCETLLAAKDELAGDGELNWTQDVKIDSGEWTGVTVGGEEGAMRVTMLGLHGQGLSGTIPAGLGNLDALETLYLHRNSLSGMVPGELGNLANLTMLRVDNNELDGIEEGIGGASSLVTFYAHRNHLKGSIPADLGNLDSLEWLRLDSQISSDRPDDGLTGGIPAELAGMDSIERIYLHRNKLSGEIPAALGMNTTLTHITLQQNDLSGSIPSELSGMTSLVWLGLYSNELSGTIPASLGMLSNLQRLYLHDNSLTGSVPAEIGNLSALTNLWLQDNNLSGALPNELDNLTNLERVRIAPNGFTGCVPAALANADSTDADDLGLPTCNGG